MSDWNTQIIEEFRANEGRVGGPFEGATMIIIHTKGAKTGAERETPLVRFPQADGSNWIVASAAGAPKHPAWYHNIVANPTFEAEFGTETATVKATELAGDEREAAWDAIVAVAPGFADYKTKTDPIGRVIPILRLDPVA